MDQNINPSTLGLAFDALAEVQARPALASITVALEPVRISIGASSMLLLSIGDSTDGQRAETLGWSGSAPWLADYASSEIAYIDPIPRAVRRTRRPVTLGMFRAGLPDEGAEGRSVLDDFFRSVGIGDFIIVPVLRRGSVVATFGIHFREPDAAAPAGALAGLIGCGLYEAARGDRFAEDRRGMRELTPREIECVRWASEGRTSWDIGELLGIGERTVNAHLERATAKLGAENRTQTVAKAIRMGIIR